MQSCCCFVQVVSGNRASAGVDAVQAVVSPSMLSTNGDLTTCSLCRLTKEQSRPVIEARNTLGWLICFLTENQTTLRPILTLNLK